MTASLFTKLTAAIYPNGVAPSKADVRLWGKEAEAALGAQFVAGPLLGGQIVAAAAANALTIAVKTDAGNDPSAAEPVWAVLRKAVGDGGSSIIKIVAATSLVISAGSTLGGESRPTIRVVGFDDAGTFRLGAICCYAGGTYYPLGSAGVASSTAEGGSGAADSAGVFYTGSAVTAKAWSLLATLRWAGTAISSGLWAAAPDVVSAFVAGGHVPRDNRPAFLSGLAMANNTSDANNDIDIAAGVAQPDGDHAPIFLPATLTKRSDAAWSAGSGNGGMDSGSKGNNQWLYVWLIGKSSDPAAVDALFSASATAPTMPSGYDLRALIWVVRTNGSGNFLGFRQAGDRCTWSAPIQDVTDTNPGTSAVLRTLTVPPNFDALFVYALNNVTTAATQTLVTETAQPDTAPSTSIYHLRTTATNQVAFIEARRRVDASSQIRGRQSASGASDAVNINTVGWDFPKRRTAA